MNNKLKQQSAIFLFFIFLFSTQESLFSSTKFSFSEYENTIESSSLDEIAKPKVPLLINVTNLKTPTGTIIIGVYGTKNRFLDSKDKIKEYRFKPVNGKFSIQISDLPYGDIALAIFQDVDEDGKMDKNFIGIPKEPYAFSRNYRPRFHAPSFKDCNIKYNHNTHNIDMALIP